MRTRTGSALANGLGQEPGSSLGFVNPVLDEHIAWGWFLISQVCFGIVAGLVVARQERIRTTQSLPFAMRVGLETPGLIHEHRDEDKH